MHMADIGQATRLAKGARQRSGPDSMTAHTRRGLCMLGVGAALAHAPDLWAQTAAGLPGARNSQVSGVVFDSLSATPLRDAFVQLVVEASPSRAFSTRSDERGRFRFDSVSPGDYVVGFIHPRLDSLLLAPIVRPDTVSPGRDTSAVLYVPSRDRLATAFCITDAGQSGDALFLGHLVFADSSRSAATGEVRAEWSELVVNDRSVRTQRRVATTTSSADGGFALCGLPVSTRVTVRAYVGSDSSAVAELDVPESGMLLRDIFVSQQAHAREAAASASRAGTSVSVSASAASRATRTTFTAESTRAGSVRSTSGAAIAGARIIVRDATEIRTDSVGRFTLTSGWLGTRMLDVRALGYQPRRLAVDLQAGNATPIDIILAPFSNELALVRISASQWREGFDGRRTKHVGLFVDEATIRARDPMMVADIVRSLPGVRLVRTGGFSDKVLLGTVRSACEPSVYVDGRLRVEGTENLDAIVQADDVRAVEVYRYAAEVPAQFLSPVGCGAILIWRGPRPSS